MNTSIESSDVASTPQKQSTPQPSPGSTPSSPGSNTKLSAAAQPYTPTKRTQQAFPATPPRPQSVTSDSVPTSPVSPSPTLNAVPASRVSKLQPEGESYTEAPAEAPKLNTPWTLYADSAPIVQIGAPTQADGGGFNPSVIKQVGDMETFWRLFHSIPLPSSRVPNFTYYFFRKTINPSWEDPRNKNGGRFGVVLWDRDRTGLQDRGLADDVWQLALVLLAGESLPEPLSINGVVLKVRQRTVFLELWCKQAPKTQLQALADGLRKQISPFITTGIDRFDYFNHLSETPADNGNAAAGAEKGPKKPNVKAVDKKLAKLQAKREPDYQL